MKTRRETCKLEKRENFDTSGVQKTARSLLRSSKHSDEMDPEKIGRSLSAHNVHQEVKCLGVLLAPKGHPWPKASISQFNEKGKSS